jgi:hypothetical protein
VANAEGVSRERVASSWEKPSPARASRGHPLPQAGEGKARARKFAQSNFDPNAGTLEDDDEAFQAYLKTLPKAEAQAWYQAAITRRYEKQRRLVNNVFLFWTVCDDGACKRSEACAGNPHECFTRWWRWVPERCKEYFRAYVRARADDSTHEQANRYAEAEVKRLADHIARVEAEQDARFEALAAAERAQGGEAAVPAAQMPAAQIPPAQSPQPREPPRGTRIRVL